MVSSHHKYVINILGVFTSTGVTGYKGIRVTFLHLNTFQQVTLIPRYPGACEYPYYAMRIFFLFGVFYTNPDHLRLSDSL